MLRRSASWRVLVVAVVTAVVGLGFTVAGARADWPVPAADQSAWFDFNRDLKDPTLTYTQKVLCNSFTAAGKATLYPYNVPEGSKAAYQWAYRNNSTKGVTVTPNSTATGDMDAEGLAFFVTSLHISGNYAFKASVECQSNDPNANGTVGTPVATDLHATDATIHVTFDNTDFASQPYKYWVEFGNASEVYTKRTAEVSVNLAAGTTSEAVPVTDLTPGTAYHYRVALESEGEDYAGETSYSGADQQFSTVAGSDG